MGSCENTLMPRKELKWTYWIINMNYIVLEYLLLSQIKDVCTKSYLSMKIIIIHDIHKICISSCELIIQQIWYTLWYYTENGNVCPLRFIFYGTCLIFNQTENYAIKITIFSDSNTIWLWQIVLLPCKDIRSVILILLPLNTKKSQSL